MSLSTQVEESLLDAQEDLRNALAFSARGEKPYVSKHIADLLHNIENLLTVVPMLEKAEEIFTDES
jgi:hypothetical protein|tara:strand:+ start:391 stop:588 length:198 start_codon:yes stop_codon:yes gene_type:complete